MHHFAIANVDVVVGLRRDESQSQLIALSLGSIALKKVVCDLVKCLLWDTSLH